MFRQLICLLKGHKKVTTVYEKESDLSNKEIASLAKLVGAKPKENFLKRQEADPERKTKMTDVRVHCERCGKVLPNFNEAAELLRKYQNPDR